MTPKATKARPPNTPPTMAPIGVLFLLSGVAWLEGDALGVAVGVDDEAVLLAVLDDALALDDTAADTR
jgi:hypothetical protein